ncbi:MAG: 50S ribosomal protein L18 [Thermogutta sp.]
MSQLKRLQRRRLRRIFRVRNKLRRVSNRPRLSVFRSNKHIYAQVIDDSQGRTLAAASTVEPTIREMINGYGGNIQAAAVVGKIIAERAIAAGVSKVVFDRGRYKYHGRLAALADAARDAGLDIGPKKEVEAAPVEEKAKKKSEKGSSKKGEKAGKNG